MCLHKGNVFCLLCCVFNFDRMMKVSFDHWKIDSFGTVEKAFIFSLSWELLWLFDRWEV